MTTIKDNLYYPKKNPMQEPVPGLKKKCTIFSDIDGCLFKYRKFETYKSTEVESIQSVVERINKAYNDGHHIVLTTARPEYLRTHTLKELDKSNISFHQLVMGIARGTRFLINDMEDPKVNRAYSFNLVRNEGFEKNSRELFLWDGLLN
jgi:hypothetical protein